MRDTLLRDPRFGASRLDRSRLLFESGLTIRTSRDPIAQASAQVAANGVIPPGNRVAAAVIVVAPGTG